MKSEEVPNAKVWDGKNLFATYLSALYLLNLNDIVSNAEILEAHSLRSREEKMIGNYLPQIEEYYESLKNELELMGQPWHYVPTSMLNILLFEFTIEISERLKTPNDAEHFSIILNWFEKSPKNVEVSLIQEWSLDDFDGDANRTVVVRLTDKKKKVTEKRVVLWMKNIRKAIEFIARDSQRKVLQAKIIGLTKQETTNTRPLEVTGINKDNNDQGITAPAIDLLQSLQINIGVSKWNANPDLLFKIFGVLIEKGHIETNLETLKAVINQNFVNKENEPLLDLELVASHDKINIACNVKALAELFLYLAYEKIDDSKKDSPFYLSGRGEGVKRILKNCFSIKTKDDTLRSYIQDFENSVQLNGLASTLKFYRNQRRKKNFIPLIQELLIPE